MKSEQGFTLVELLAALAAGALLLGALGALTGMIGRESRQLTRPDSFDEIAAAAPVLRTLLGQALHDQAGRSTLTGDEGGIQATVEPPQSRMMAGSLKLALDVRRTSKGEALELTLSPIEPAQGTAWTEQRTLVHDMKSIDLHLTRNPDARPGDPPRLVEIAFVTLTGQHWDIVVEPVLRGWAGCVFDPISLQCRS